MYTNNEQVFAISGGVVAKIQAQMAEKEMKAYAESNGIAEEVFGAVRTVLAFGGQKKEVQRFQESIQIASKAGIRRGLVTGIGNGLYWAIFYASYSLAFWYGMNLIFNSCSGGTKYDTTSLLVVFFSVLTGAMTIGQVTPYVEAFSVARGAAASIFSVIDRVPIIDSLSPAGITPGQCTTGSISFENINFSYPVREQVTILRNTSFSIAPGETVALVGASGCGKSTCIQLIQRLYDPHSGHVKIDGTDVKQLNLAWLRSQLGVVGQEPILFGMTIGQNIQYGKEDASMEDIIRSAKEANAHDFIMKLPKKYDTEVGERGAQLSGGQKQRIAIARALISNPKILLLDEATSALDTQSESVVQQALDKARLGRTTVIVAHRLSTIRNVDRIIALKDGRVEVRFNSFSFASLTAFVYIN